MFTARRLYKSFGVKGLRRVGRIETQLHIFSSTGLDREEWATAGSGRFTSRKIPNTI
jgi:hypothetical protein